MLGLPRNTGVFRWLGKKGKKGKKGKGSPFGKGKKGKGGAKGYGAWYKPKKVRVTLRTKKKS